MASALTYHYHGPRPKTKRDLMRAGMPKNSVMTTTYVEGAAAAGTANLTMNPLTKGCDWPCKYPQGRYLARLDRVVGDGIVLTDIIVRIGLPQGVVPTSSASLMPEACIRWMTLKLTGPFRRSKRGCDGPPLFVLYIVRASENIMRILQSEENCLRSSFGRRRDRTDKCFLYPNDRCWNLGCEFFFDEGAL
jgi:hypothetical protein